VITRDQFREAIDAARGNITHAAILLKISKTHAMRLTIIHAMREHARALRLAAGAPATGRPGRDVKR
jgi:hypothetical protein